MSIPCRLRQDVQPGLKSLGAYIITIIIIII